MVLAHIPDLTPLLIPPLLLAGALVFVLCSKDKNRALAMAFAAVCVGFSLYLLYLMITPR
jgi:hypothetical protein